LLFCSHEFAHQAFLEWKAGRRDELSEYQKQIGDQQLSYVEKELERWQNVGERAMM
jgi:hypothetical protein